MDRNEIGKELIIALLLFIAIMLVVFAILYSFSPTNKVMPEDITYTTAENVQTELQATAGLNAESIISTYTLGQNELYTYQATNDYRPGKVNPFSTYVVQNQNEEEEDGTSKNSTSGQTGNSSGSSNTSSGGNSSKSTPIAPGEVNPGNYTKDKGLK